MSWNELYFGTAYCPYAKSGDIAPEFFERDVITMKKLGMNIIRPFVAWDRIERKEGVYDYSKLDLIFDLAEKHGLKILLNLGGTLTSWGAMYPPRYIVRKSGIQERVQGECRTKFIWILPNRSPQSRHRLNGTKGD